MISEASRRKRLDRGIKVRSDSTVRLSVLAGPKLVRPETVEITKNSNYSKKMVIVNGKKSTLKLVLVA